jgi:hypothetical protein
MGCSASLPLELVNRSDTMRDEVTASPTVRDGGGLCNPQHDELDRSKYQELLPFVIASVPTEVEQERISVS